MTDLGLAFDDDDLDNQKKRHGYDRDLPYHVKIHEPRWFDDGEQSVENDQRPFLLKFSGDNHYRLKNYEAAVDKYKSALDVLPENNVAVSQDLRESVARCYAHMGCYDQALQLARDMVKEMAVEDEAHQRQALILLSFVCQKAGLYEEWIETLQKLCVLQPNFPQSWIQLGDAVVNQAATNNTNSTNCDTDKSDSVQNNSDKHPEGEISENNTNTGITNSCSEWGDGPCKNGNDGIESSENNTVERHHIVALTCYVRAKLLMDSVMANASEVIKERNLKIIAEVKEKIQKLTLSEDIIQRAFQTSRKYIDTSADDSKRKEKPSQNTERCEDFVEQRGISSSFYNKFCSWYIN